MPRGDSSGIDRAAEWASLILLAPKQATFQLERQLLETGELNGYTRLQILSFDRFADFVLTELGFSAGELLSEEGRLMVLRALLAKHRDDLSLYRSAARMPGFAGQLSELLRESRRHHLDATRMESLAGDEKLSERLRAKLADVSRIASAYRVWLEENELNDADEILDLAAKRLGNSRCRRDWIRRIRRRSIFQVFGWMVLRR